ncbi:hypothetical protein MtrunA17_Chr1g0167991 [Medicago truncatula]|uniref:Transmembrane protein n=1 Tax=Medicago truncatula TaxID=3880 RepID=A0A396JVA8_MEDTR|nr:hypothetical protein MtrunA17_Chr1g0167991 [Medicago truncatula]
MIKNNALILEEDSQNQFSLSFLYTFFLICMKWKIGSVKLKRRE